MLRAIDFDFAAKVDREIGEGDVRASIDAGRFVWIDIDGADAGDTREKLKSLLKLDDRLLDECLGLTPDTKYDLRTTWLHLVIASVALTGGELEEDRVDVIIGEGWLLTLHRDQVPFLERVRAHYHDDFVSFARSFGFLLYEMWDSLIDCFEDVESKLARDVELMQQRILSSFDESMFADFARLTNDLLHLRKVLAPTRNVLDELATRKSRFVPEGTQPFLGGMVPRVERIIQDVMVNREILSNALGLHVALQDNKLNRSMQKLTVLSAIFLPLTFLCGVYGMNFENLPEKEWQYGYLYFWIACALIVSTVLWLMRKAKLL